MGRRSKARELAFQMLYQWDQTDDPIERVQALFWKVRSTTDQTRLMADRLAKGAQNAAVELDAALTPLITNWRYERVAPVDRTILRLAAYELLHEPGTPAAVVIDEAVELG